LAAFVDDYISFLQTQFEEILSNLCDGWSDY